MQQMDELNRARETSSFAGHLSVRISSGRNLSPNQVFAWPADSVFYCAVSATSVTGEKSSVQKTPSATMKDNGVVSWDDEKLRFELRGELEQLQFRVKLRRHGNKMVLGTCRIEVSPLLWCPHPNWRRLELGVKCNNWKEVAGKSAEHTIGILIVDVQYSFVRLATIYRDHNLRTQNPNNLLDHCAMLKTLHHAVYRSIAADDADQRTALAWLMREYGELYGIGIVSRELLRLESLCPGPHGAFNCP